MCTSLLSSLPNFVCLWEIFLDLYSSVVCAFVVAPYIRSGDNATPPLPPPPLLPQSISPQAKVDTDKKKQKLNVKKLRGDIYVPWQSSPELAVDDLVLGLPVSSLAAGGGGIRDSQNRYRPCGYLVTRYHTPLVLLFPASHPGFRRFRGRRTCSWRYRAPSAEKVDPWCGAFIYTFRSPVDFSAFTSSMTFPWNHF